MEGILLPVKQFLWQGCTDSQEENDGGPTRQNLGEGRLEATNLNHFHD
jgi:hypothetical protein